MLPEFTRKNPLTKIGILVKDLRPSTRNYNIIDLGNKITRENINIDFYVFNEDWKVPPNTFSFPVLQQRNAWGFDGILISTDIPTTKKLIALPNTCKKYFYVWDMAEWNKLNNIKDVYDIYANPDIMLIARSDFYLGILYKNFDVPVLTIKDFNYDQIIQLCNSFQGRKTTISN